MSRCSGRRTWCLGLAVVGAWLLVGLIARAQQFTLAPAVAVEAEEFSIKSGWQVLAYGQGNYMVDIIGFNHVSGERLLRLPSAAAAGRAEKDVTVPVAGGYHLWVRYEYPPFCEARFRAAIEQGGKVVAEKTMGAKDNPRLSFGDVQFKAQYDPAWGSEGLSEEVLEAQLTAGPARLVLEGVAQPQIPGVSADRNIDLLYLSSDTRDEWRQHYRGPCPLYPILEAFRDTRGARWEAQFTNQGTTPAAFVATHVYNRVPWGVPHDQTKAVLPNQSSPWLPLAGQDTTHFSLTGFAALPRVPFTVALRPVGGQPVRTLTFRDEGHAAAYIPPYPGWPEQPITPLEELDAVLALLAKTPVIGKAPTQPLCYGGWIPVDAADTYGRKYAQLYLALGMRSLGVWDPLKGLANLEPLGFKRTRSLSAMEYRNPPVAANIQRWQERLTKDGLLPCLRFYDYGDEIHFAEWFGTLGVKDLPERWQAWLTANRPGFRSDDYWLPNWGRLNPAKLQTDSSAVAAAARPRLYVDSLRFYEETAINAVATGRNEVRRAFGDEVLAGANYSGHPFYYPELAMYVYWFRGGAADLGRHSEYFWEVGQPGPLVNGYVAEHFRCGMRNHPRALLRQYTMPHAPGNTDADFLRTAFTHLAHGARALDFFGIGMNECFTENHIDHRYHQRYVSIRDVTHALGLVEDLVPESQVVPSRVALLVSRSTQAWDFAGAARDLGDYDRFGPDFRKIRLCYHLERLGLWYALTFLGAAPDLLVEEDLTPELLREYQVLYIVGDCLPVKYVPMVTAWVNDGGCLYATASAGTADEYRVPTAAWAGLFGVKERQTELVTPFVRPRMELPFLAPLATVQAGAQTMPQLAIREHVKAADGAETLATFREDGSPAALSRPLGKGRVFYLAALPGLAYLYTALQPPAVPDRALGVHTIPVNFDPGAEWLIGRPLAAVAFRPLVQTDVKLIDTRLLAAPRGWVLPLANYRREVGQPVTVSIAMPGPIRRAVSAYCGELPVKQADGRWQVTIPKLGYGDLLRLEK